MENALKILNLPDVIFSSSRYLFQVGSSLIRSGIPLDDAHEIPSETEEKGEVESGGDAENKRSIMNNRSLTQPPGTKAYSVGPSDTLAGIAARFDTTPSELVRLNRLVNRLIFPGQMLYVPDKKGEGGADESCSEGDDSSSNGQDAKTVESPKPGHVERVKCPFGTIPLGSPTRREDAERGSSGTATGDREKFLKINVKHITDGQGVVTGVLLVTPNAIMFDPNVMDSLVIEQGTECYGVIAPMECVVNAALYRDIAHMRVRHTPISQQCVPHPEVYHPESRRAARPSQSESVMAEVGTPTEDRESLDSGATSLRSPTFPSKSIDSDTFEDQTLSDSLPPPPPPQRPNTEEDDARPPLEHSAHVLPDRPEDQDPDPTTTTSNNEEEVEETTEAAAAPSSSSSSMNPVYLLKRRDSSCGDNNNSRASSQERRPSCDDSKIMVASSSSTPKVGFKSVVSVDDMPKLFATIDQLIPKPAQSNDTAPLFLCLRMGRPSNRDLPKTTPIMSYGKKRMRREYWFSIPKERVDDLYLFFHHWAPGIYGDLMEDLIEARGFHLVGSDEERSSDEEEDAAAGKDDAAARESSFFTEPTSTDWEIVNASEIQRQKSLSLDFEPTLPDLIGVTEFLEESHRKELVNHLPARAEGYAWSLIFSTSQHGFSLQTLYRRMLKVESPVLLVIMDTEKNVFGAQISCALKLSDHFYGTGESFLFTFYPEFKVFNWSGENLYFVKGNNESLVIGAGDGSFGLWLDGDLYHGRSQSCKTYANEMLTSNEDFHVKTLEAWGFTEPLLAEEANSSTC